MSRNPFEVLDRSLRSLAFDVFRRRDGLSGWKAARRDFRRCLRKSADMLARDTEVRVRNIVIHACETSPYYRDLCRDLGLQPSAAFSLEDLRHFPLLTKEIIKQKGPQLISERIGRHELDVEFTSGTTGRRTEFQRNHQCTVSRVGRQTGILEQCGYRPGERRALLWGVESEVPAAGIRGLRQRLRHFADSQESVCCKVMNERDMEEFHARLLRFRPAVLYGYPNAMARLGRFILERKLAPIRVRTIMSTAERLTLQTREFLNAVFGAEVYDLYCTREYGCVGFECSMHDGYHIDTGSVYLEIVREGRRVELGETGEITITDLLNYGMPLIRSRTGDIGTLSAEPCACGSGLPLLKSFDGRMPDNIVRPDGSIVAGILVSYMFMDLPQIKAAQFVQESVTDLEVRLEVGEELSEETRASVLRQVRERVGQEISVRVTPVREIPRNPLSGKLQEVISKIGRAQGAAGTATGSHGMAPGGAGPSERGLYGGACGDRDGSGT